MITRSQTRSKVKGLHSSEKGTFLTKSTSGQYFLIFYHSQGFIETKKVDTRDQ